MVRVISVHHFDSQVIQTCEQPLAATSAAPDRILTALAHHVIEVLDLTGTEPSFSFPTVDRVHELRYCATGHYVVTLEKKQTRQSRDVAYARVYTNWDKRPDSGSEQAMRARIAGRVTPSSSQIGADVLEVIELPVRFSNISTMACCQETGNVLVGSENVVCLFQLVTRTHDISRQKFLDFELWPVTLELSFSPIQLAMSEDVVAAMSATCLHVFRINKGFARPTDWSSASAQASPWKSTKPRRPSLKSHDKKMKAEEEKGRSTSPIRLDQLLREASEAGLEPHETKKLANGSISVLALLPQIASSNVVKHPAKHLRGSPFKPPNTVMMGIAIREIPANEPWAEQMTTMVESLLQLEIGDWRSDIAKEEMKCLALRPLYRVNAYYTSKNESSCPRLRSAAYGNLIAFNCVICTNQEGFMYNFPVHEGEVLSLGKCISEYNFTSSVKHIVLEPYLLHVLTTTGLESYTTRAIHAIEADNDELSCPPTQEPVCLVGLRPFIGVVDVLLTKSFVVIMSSASDANARYESHEETLYCLRLPTAGTLYSDMMAIGSSHRFSSPQTYWQLLTEAHAVLRMVTAVSTDPDHRPDLIEAELYLESCALLAEYYLCYDDEEDWNIGYKYSIMAKLTPTQLMDRLKKLEQEARSAGCNVKYAGGLLYYLKMCLIDCEDETKMPVGALNTLLDMVDTTKEPGKPFLLSSLILESSLLRQFSTERTIRMISSKIKASGKTVDALDCLALAVLYTSKGKFQEAGEALELCDDGAHYVEFLGDFWPLLFDNSRKQAQVTPEDWEGVTLSELSVLLMDKKPTVLATVLKELVTRTETLKLQQLLEVFLVYLPARMSQEGMKIAPVLQLFLEGVFDEWHKRDPTTPLKSRGAHAIDSLKILVRCLSSRLGPKTGDQAELNIQLKEPTELFGGKRHKFLDLLPPCNDPNFDPKSHASLLKLQCLLCSKWLNEVVEAGLVDVIGNFVDQDYGSSLFILAQPDKAVELLLNNYPSALILYVAEMFTMDQDLKNVVTEVHRRANEEAANSESESNTYTKLLDDLLEHLADILELERFNQIAPPGNEFKKYREKAQRTENLNYIRGMIIDHGHRLLDSLNGKIFPEEAIQRRPYYGRPPFDRDSARALLDPNGTRIGPARPLD